MIALTNDVLFHSLKINQYIGTGNKAHLGRLKEIERNIRSHLDSLKQHARRRNEKIIEEIAGDYQTYLSLSDRLLKLSKKNPQDLAVIEGNQMIIAALLENGILKKAYLFYQMNKATTDELAQKNHARYARSIWITLLFALIVIAFSITHSAFLHRAINKPILQLINATEEVAHGDLAARAAIQTPDEIGILAKAFNTMSEELQRLIGSLENRVQERLIGNSIFEDN